MNAPRKPTLVLLVGLIAILAISILASSAIAQSNLSIQVAPPTTSNYGVNEQATYTFTVTNKGYTNVGAINVTLPFGGYVGGYVNVQNLKAPQDWTITSQDSQYVLLTSKTQGLANGQSVTFSFDATNPQVAGTYVWYIQASQNATAAGLTTAETAVNVNTNLAVTSLLPALAIFGIAAGIAFLNSGINRALIGYFIGWEQYRVMQKEMAEFRSESMAAARANDKKQMEKLKKKKSQMDAMQAKMLKPQMVQFGISFIYIVVWLFVLTPTFGNSSIAYIPGFGPISVLYFYPICSIFLGLLSSRIIGIMPIEQ